MTRQGRGGQFSWASWLPDETGRLPLLDMELSSRLFGVALNVRFGICEFVYTSADESGSDP